MARSKTEYRSLSKRARLLLSRSEGMDVEFKESIGGLDSSDLVAFANSETGGAILIGVREQRDGSGKQVGVPIGITVGDSERLKILNKAIACVPPVQVQLFLENLDDRPFFRLEIPRGDYRPYCSGGGTYKTREDGRVRALHPEGLLQLFLDREAAEFRDRFGEATRGILTTLEDAVGSIAAIQANIDEKFDDISSTLGWADSNVEDTKSTIDEVESACGRLEQQLANLQERTLVLIAHEKLVDPVRDRAKAALSKQIAKQLTDDPSLMEGALAGHTMSIRWTGEFPFSKKDLEEIFHEVVESLRTDAA